MHFKMAKASNAGRFNSINTESNKECRLLTVMSLRGKQEPRGSKGLYPEKGEEVLGG